MNSKMMEDGVTFALGVVAVVVAIIVIMALCSIPFAFIGMILLSFIGLFSEVVELSYWNCFIAGAGVTLIVGLIQAMNSK